MKLFGAVAAAALLLASNAAAAADAPRVTIRIAAERPGAKIDRRIFGQFAEHLGTGIYGGIWVGAESPIPNTNGYRNDVVQALRDLKVPLVRWPGGCFADEYVWREGIGPRGKRPIKINTHWGGVTEPNSFGTHEFMDFAELIGAEAYVSGNVGGGTPREMAEWVEYMTSPAGSLADERKRNGRAAPWKLPVFGLGNELWGCGGNMRAEYAADVTRRYATFVKVPAGTSTLKIASGASGDDYHWTEVMMRDAGKLIDGVGLHYYTLPGDWTKKGPATGFDETEWATTLAKAVKLDDYIARHSAIMDKYDQEKKVILAVDEWGTWYDPTPGTNPGFLQQENTLRDAMVAALTINIFARHAERVRLANIAQMVNVLQAMILTREGEMVLTPTYHAFRMYVPFQDATAVPVEVDSPTYGSGEITLPAVSAAAARGKDGKLYLALVNVDPNRAAPVSAQLPGRRATATILTGPRMDAMNDFGRAPAVAPQPFAGVRLSGGTLRATLPAKSIVMIAVE
ncbi:MAG TPA: alpha-L-arabinofuranosidase C-terminal domain-containing protein [Allosphingosinicella sp.]|jgi:alpha-N-arabinofuranosidase